MKKYLYLILLGALLAGNTFGARKENPDRVPQGQIPPAQVRQSRSGRMVRKADINFVRGDFQRAMTLYQRALAALEKKSGNDRLTLEQRRALYEEHNILALKMARNYILLQEPEQAINYYEKVCSAADTLMTVNDVCFYVDALRRLGDNQQAEIAARNFAFRQPYSRNQRYINTLASLSNVQRYYGRGDADYSVTLQNLNTPEAEYWLGEWKGKPFYALSRGQMQDPLKIFYHRTQFYSLYDGSVPEVFREIPRELQRGPLAFSPDGKTMIATALVYRNTDRIISTDLDAGLFVNQLYFSRFDDVRGRWSDFRPLFEHQEGFSYGHPAFFNDGQSLIFSSDRPGGYGGMDLYISHWDKKKNNWDQPVNMGRAVNTEGDEIYPRVVGDALYFASNGLEGFGGYDIYRVSMVNDVLVPGTMFHYPYPVNSVYNDFGIFFDGLKGYFISDRRGISGKDDIYTFDNTISPLSSKSAIGVSAEYSAMVGNLNLISELGNSNTESFEAQIIESQIYPQPSVGDILISVYFGFNSAELNEESLDKLRNLVESMAFNDLNAISVFGYADEFGSEKYNLSLSEKRAMTVAENLAKLGAGPTMYPEGKGRLKVPPEAFIDALREKKKHEVTLGSSEMRPIPTTLTFEEQTEVTRKARRVDIVVKKK